MLWGGRHARDETHATRSGTFPSAVRLGLPKAHHPRLDISLHSTASTPSISTTTATSTVTATTSVVSMASPPGTAPPEGITSLLDTDLYKLTMQCAVRKYFPDVPVRYRFTNRTPHMQLNLRAFTWLEQQVAKLAALRVTDDELAWLTTTCRYLDQGYLDYLAGFRLRPAEHVTLEFNAEGEYGGDEVVGELLLDVHGLWVETILYEIPLLALISEAYFKFVDTDWTYAGQVEQAKAKGLRLLEHGCVFSEFGSRRRRSYHAHELVLRGLCEARRDAEAHPAWTGRFTGTSNVHFAHRFGLAPIGTVAHEWFMGIAAITDDYRGANETALRYWTGTFGRGVLSIALTDTFGTPAFLRAFKKPAPPPSGPTDAAAVSARQPSYADIFAGVRQDSGDPMAFLQTIRQFYASQGVAGPARKTIVFSDALDVDKCIRYKADTDAAGFAPSFGIGTFLTNDFRKASTAQQQQQQQEPGEKSVPLNIVIKLSQAAGRPCIKLSDDVGKNMGSSDLMKRIKAEVDYEAKSWEGGDEAHRWG